LGSDEGGIGRPNQEGEAEQKADQSGQPNKRKAETNKEQLPRQQSACQRKMVHRQKRDYRRHHQSDRHFFHPLSNSFFDLPKIIRLSALQISHAHQ
jgi:hypothetical protein